MDNNAGACSQEAYKGRTIIAAVPCYNEEKAIHNIVLRTLKHVNTVLVIDDGSKDRTSEYARSAGAVVISHQVNQGKGSAIKDSFDFAKKMNASILVLIDGDGQHDPGEIPLLIEPILAGKADMVSGSKFIGGSGHSMPKYRQLGHGILTSLTNLGMSQKVTDSQNGFRAFSSKTFDSFSFTQQGMAIESEMLIDADRAGIVIKEVPVTIKYGIDGSTYNPFVHGFNVMLAIIKLIMKR